MNDEEFQKCSFLSTAAATDDEGTDHAISICGKVSSRSLVCTCAGDEIDMLGCPYWRNIYVQERMWEALMEIAHNVKASGGGKN